ncbi:MAG: hypothetical protein FJW80_08105 [Actinobacteria bacterium]|nr:hypothetical protein [Actinomycetota bacterium]
MAGICILALIITQVFQIEPAGKSLDEISGRTLSGLKARPTPPLAPSLCRATPRTTAVITEAKRCPHA